VGRHEGVKPLFEIHRRCGEFQSCGPCHDRAPINVPEFRPPIGAAGLRVQAGMGKRCALPPPIGMPAKASRSSRIP
jgi:hypothetical protein